MVTQKSIKFKDGNTLPAGLPCQFEGKNPRIVLVSDKGRDEPYRVRVTSAFHAPSIEELEDWSNDGCCESVAGHSIEPDGWDSEGSPSWLLALGMI